MNKKILFFLFFLFSFPMLFGQQDLPLRIELETAKDASDYSCVPAGTHGLLVVYESEILTPDSISWAFVLYDTNLRKKNVFPVVLSHNQRLVCSFFVDNKVLFLFQNFPEKKNNPLSFLVSFDFLSNKMTTGIIRDLPSSENISLNAADNRVVITVGDKDKQTRIFYYDIIDKKLTEFTVKEADILADEFVEIDTFNKHVFLGLFVASSKTAALKIFETDYFGNIISEQFFPPYPEYRYNSARMTIIDSISSLIMGTFSMDNNRNAVSSHNGVYTLSYRQGRFGYPEFYNYLNLKQKDASSTTRSYNNTNLNLQLIVDKIFHDSSQYVLVTEVFYPEYNYNTSYYNDSYYYGSVNSPVTTTFSGYRYVNAYITSFDESGNLLWDYYFPFTNLLSFNLINRISLYFNHNGTAIFYPYNDHLTYTMVNGYDVVDRMNTFAIETNYSKDVVEYSRGVKVENWYGNNFLVFGYQYIRNNSKTVKNKRYVFFMNKISYR